MPDRGDWHKLASRLVLPQQPTIESYRRRNEQGVQKVRRGSAPVGTLIIEVPAMNESNHTDRLHQPAAFFAHFAQKCFFEGLITLTTSTNAQNRR